VANRSPAIAIARWTSVSYEALFATTLRAVKAPGMALFGLEPSGVV
jgi:hypothetical protein